MSRACQFDLPAQDHPRVGDPTIHRDITKSVPRELETSTQNRAPDRSSCIDEVDVNESQCIEMPGRELEQDLTNDTFVYTYERMDD